MKKQKTKKEISINNLIFDPKGELATSCFVLSEDPGLTMDGAYILNPLDRMSVGYDPLWCISPEDDQNKIRRHLKTVVEALIAHSPKQQNDKFWKDMGRSMLHGLISYYFIYKSHRYLPEICTSILSHPDIVAEIKEILEEVPSTSFICADLAVFNGMAAETLYSVYANVHAAILDFAADDDLVYCMQYNPRKVNPQTLLEHSIILSVSVDYIESYAPLIVLIYNQSIRWLLGLPEKKDDPDRAYIGLIIDETVALLNSVGGEIAALSQSLRLQRSKGVLMIICVQSIAGLKTISDQDTVNDEIANMPWKVILDCTTPDDQKTICDWSGKFSRRNTSYSNNGSGNTGENVQYNDDNIVTSSQLMTLGGSDELILISTKSGYNRLKKMFSHKDPYFKRRLDAIDKHNKKILKRRKKDDK